MRIYIAGVGAAIAGFVIAASPPAMATTWSQEFCLTDCTATPTASPISQIDIVMATPGVSFASLSSVFSDIGETTLVTSATTTLGAMESVINFSPAEIDDVFLTLGFSAPSTSTPFTFYWEQFDGSQLITTDSSVTSSDIASWDGSTWTITPMTAPLSATPLPSGAPLFATGLGLLAFMGYRRKRRMGLARESAYQFA